MQSIQNCTRAHGEKKNKTRSLPFLQGASFPVRNVNFTHKLRTHFLRVFMLSGYKSASNVRFITKGGRWPHGIVHPVGNGARKKRFKLIT